MKRLIVTIASLAILPLLQNSAYAADGAAIFKAKCAPCHGREGQGTAMAPAFKGNHFIGGSSIERISDVIRNGREGAAKKYRQFAIGMPKQKLSADELASVVDYLKRISGSSEVAQYRQEQEYVNTPVGVDNAMTIYKSKCAACHGSDGQGTAMAPAFKGNSYIGESSTEEIADVIKNGREGGNKKYRQFAIGMPKQNNLSQDEIAALTDFLKSLSGYAVIKERSKKVSSIKKEGDPDTIYLQRTSLKLGNNGANTGILEEHSGGIWSLAFSPDGKILASGGEDKTIILWNVKTRTRLRTLRSDSASFGIIRSVAFSPDGKKLATGNDDRTITIWNVENGNKIKSFEGHIGSVWTVSFSPDGQTLASGSLDNSVILWDIATGLKLKNLRGHDRYVRSVTFSPDGKILASGSDDGTVVLWDVINGKKIKTLEGHKGSVWSVAFSPDGTTITSGSDDGTTVLWGVRSGIRLNSMNGYASSVAYNSDGKTIATGNFNNLVNLWDANNGNKIQTFEGHTSYVRSVAFSPDGKILASGSTDKRIFLFDIGMYTVFVNEEKDIVKFNDAERDQKLMELLKPKGEFEKTKEYEERIRIAKAEEARLKKAYEERIAEANKRAEQKLKEKRAKLFPITLGVKLGKYDADNERFEAEIAENSIYINVPIRNAIEMNKHKDELSVVGFIKYVDEDNVELVNPFLVNGKTNEQFPFGKRTETLIATESQQAPPDLKITSIKLIEPSDNDVLDAGESGKIDFVLKNTGKGPAFGVSLVIDTGRALPGLRLNEKNYIGQINSGEEKQVEVDISAFEDIQSTELSLKTTLVEASGFDSKPVIIFFKTRELVPPLLQIAKVDVQDADGRRVMTKGKEAKVTLTVQNAGNGISRGVVIVAEPGDSNIRLFGDSTIKIGQLAPGAFKKASFSVAVTTRYNGPGELPLRFSIKEERERFSVRPEVKLALNEEAPELRVVRVEAKESPVAKIENTDNIDSPPVFSDEHKIMGDKDIAVVIGIERYRRLTKAEYSYNDARTVKAYLKSLGFAERNIKFLADEEATLSAINSSIRSWLPNRVKKESRVFVYYSGHGSPDPVSGEAYLIPHDGDPNYLKDTGYSLKKLYESLGRLDAAEVTVVMDACFSGSGGRSVLAKGARPAVVVIEDPVLASKNIAVLSSTQGAQISTSYSEKEHGLFTYYFLKAIKDGKKDLAEIYEYIRPLVEDSAREQNVEQSPTLKPGPELVRDRFGLKR